jgi:hypothetical protein
MVAKMRKHLSQIVASQKLGNYPFVIYDSAGSIVAAAAADSLTDTVLHFDIGTLSHFYFIIPPSARLDWGFSTRKSAFW